MTTPILTTKLYIPPARAEIVPRPRLTERLDDGQRRPASVTLVSAPPGFGKTTLVSSWLKAEESLTASPSHAPAYTAWVSLDEQDNDPIRFWAYIFAALDNIQTGVAGNAQTMLQAPEPQAIAAILTTLINAISTISQPFTLALDDYHLIERPPIHEGLTFLLENMPPQMRLVLISRSDPPLPLTRLRVRNRLCELRESDLRFTPEEAATFLNKIMNLNLSANDVAALETRTEGWIAGLQLAALSMQGRDDVRGFVQAFTGSHRYVIDYLAEEVLAQQPPSLREFLLKTSILERLSGSLCDAVLSRGAGEQRSRGDNVIPPAPLPLSPSAQVLEHLEQANLFLIPLDDERRWYRYHHLFADFLREHLSRTVSQTDLSALHQRASEWYLSHDSPTEAVNHALAAQDMERVVQLIEQVSVDLLILGEAVTLLKWLEALPEETIRARPRLSLTKGWSNLILGYFDDVEGSMRDAEAGLIAHEKEGEASRRVHPGVDVRGLWGEVDAMHSMILGERGQIEEAIALSEKALKRLPENTQLARSVIQMNLGSNYETIGQLDKAAEHLSTSVDLAESSGNLIMVLSSNGVLAEVYQGQGRLAEAEARYRRALTYIEGYTQEHTYSGQSLPMAGRTYLGLAEVARKRNDLDQARHYLQIGVDLGRQGDIGGALHVGHIIQAQIEQAEGDLDKAHESIEKAKQFPQDIAPTFDWASAVQSRLWLAQGNLSAAAQWAETCGLPLDENFRYAQFPGEYATLVRVYIAQEEFEAAIDLLDRMQAVEEMVNRDTRRLEILMLQALVNYAQGDLDRALPPLEKALTLAEHTGYTRLLLDEGPPLADLLRRAFSRLEMKPFISQLLTAFGSQKPDGNGAERKAPSFDLVSDSNSTLIEPLSDRELEVLSLIAEGLSNQEIADKLVIAEGTVKKHIHNIFGKLDVRRRTQVVLRAKELGLLVD